MGQTYETGTVVFEHWAITKKLGGGSFGNVYELERQDFGETYRAALKVVSVPQSEDEVRSVMEEGMSYAEAQRYFYGVVEDLVREFSIMSKLRGTANVVDYMDHLVVPHEDGVGWDILIRMELLTPVLTYAYQHPMSRRDVIRLGIDMCRALELCQKYNIIHRDIKPENIFVSENGDFKLGDFGIARTIESTMSGLSQKGTYSYMAPEVFHGKEYGYSVDIYSLGIVLYRLLNKNRTPFLPPAPAPITHGARGDALARRIGGEAIPKPYYSEGRLSEIVLKACAYDPKERYSSPEQMRRELEAILYDQSDSELIYPDGDGVTMDENDYRSSSGGNSGSPRPVQNTVKLDDTWTRPMPRPEERQEHSAPPEDNQEDAFVPRKRRGKTAICAMVIVLALLAIAVGVFLRMRSRQDGVTAQAVGSTQVSAAYDDRNMSGSISVSQGARRPVEIPEAANVVLLDINWTSKKEMTEPLYITVSDPGFPDGDGLAVYHCESDGRWNLIGTYVIRDHAVTFLTESLSPFAFQVVSSAPEVSPTPVPTAIPSPAPIYAEVVEQDGMPVVQLPDDNVLARQLLTEKDRQQAAVGAPVSVRLDVLNVDKTVTQEEKALVDGALKDLSGVGAVGQYMDLRLSKIVNGLQTPLTGPLAQELLLVIDIPDALRADGRAFVAIRIHEGVAAVLRDQDKDPNTITILTDQFSIYALAYTETAPPSPTPLWAQVPIPAPAATTAPPAPTPTPSTEVTPEPGTEVTPEPGSEVTAEPTQEPGSEVTAEPAQESGSEVTPASAPDTGTGQGAPPETGGEVR